MVNSARCGDIVLCGSVQDQRSGSLFGPFSNNYLQRNLPSCDRHSLDSPADLGRLFGCLVEGGFTQ